jgi:GMP synthase PP-ATPase subunit
MNLKELNNCIINKTNLYINDRAIKILQIFDIFNICEVAYIDNKEKAIIDIMGITRKKQKNKFISLHRLGGIDN